MGWGNDPVVQSPAVSTNSGQGPVLDSKGNDVTVDPHAAPAVTSDVTLPQAAGGWGNDPIVSKAPATGGWGNDPIVKAAVEPDTPPPAIPPLPDDPSYVEKVGYGLTQGITGLAHAAVTHPVQTLAGVAASVPNFVGGLLPWIEAGMNIPKTSYDLATKGWRGTVQGIQKTADATGNIATPNNPSQSFQAGQGAMGIPFTPLTEANKYITDPDVKTLAEAGENIALGLAGGKAGKGAMKGEFIPKDKAGVGPENIPPPKGATYEGEVTKEIGFAPDTPIATTSPPAKAPMLVNQAVLEKQIADLKAADPQAVAPLAKVVDTDAVNKVSDNPSIPHDQQVTTPQQRAAQVDTLWNTNELSKNLQKGVEEDARMDAQNQAVEQAMPQEPHPIAGAVVRFDGKEYDAPTHPQAIKLAMEDGVPTRKSNNVTVPVLDPAKGDSINLFRTQEGKVITRDEAGALMDGAKRTEDMPPMSPNKGKFGQGGGMIIGDPFGVGKALQRMFIDGKEGRRPMDDVVQTMYKVGVDPSKAIPALEAAYVPDRPKGFPKADENMPSIYIGDSPANMQLIFRDRLQHYGIHVMKENYKPGVLQFATEADANKARTLIGMKLAGGGLGGKQAGVIDMRRGGKPKPQPEPDINGNPAEPGILPNGEKNWSLLAPGEKNPKQIVQNGEVKIDGWEQVRALARMFPKEFEDFEKWMFEDTNRDLKQQEFGGVTTASFRSKNRLISNMERLPELVFHLLNTSMGKLYHEESVMKAEFADGNIGHNEYYGLTLFHTAKRDLFRKDLAIRSSFDGTQGWFDGVNWFPTKEQYMQKGMSSASADVWVKNDKNIATMWSYLEKALAFRGNAPPTRIPGWLPHVWKGPYQVIGKIGDEIAARYNYNTRSAMMDALKAAQTKTDSLGRKDIEWSTQVNSTNELAGMSDIKDLFAPRTTLEKQQEVQNLMGNMATPTYRGIISMAMERSDAPVTGHLLERMNEAADGNFSLSRSQEKDAMKLLQQSQQTVISYLSKTKYTSEYLGPYEMAGLLPFDSHGNPSELRQAVTHITNQFFGKPEKIAREFDNKFREDLQEKGMNPELAGQIGRALHTSFSTFFLFGKPDFYIANYFQKTLGLPILMLRQAQGTLRGEQTGSIIKAMEFAMVGRYSDEGRMAIQYAKDHGHMDPNYTDALNPGFQDPISRLIEMDTRKSLFLQGYGYYRQIASQDYALALAGKFADDGAVPYAGRFGQPVAMGRLPKSVQPFYLFFAYPLHMLSLTSEGIRTTYTAARDVARIGGGGEPNLLLPNPNGPLLLNGPKGRAQSVKALTQSLVSVFALQAMGVALFGLGGMVAMNGYDGLTHAFDMLFGVYIPDSKDLKMRWGKMIEESIKGPVGKKLSEIEQLGTISAFLGYNVSQSGAGAMVPNASAGKTVMLSAFEAAWLVVRNELGRHDILNQKPVVRQEWLDLLKEQPARIAEPFEYYLKTPSLSDIGDRILGKVPDFTIGRDNGHINIAEKGMPRSQQDTVAALFGGLKSNTEAQSNMADQVAGQMFKTQEREKEFMILAMRDPAVPMVTKEKYMIEMAFKFHEDPSQYQDMIVKAMENATLTDAQRKIMKAIESDPEYLRWRQRQQLSQTPQDSTSLRGLLSNGTSK